MGGAAHGGVWAVNESSSFKVITCGRGALCCLTTVLNCGCDYNAAVKSLTFSQSSMNRSRLSVQHAPPPPPGEHSVLFATHKIDHLSPSTIFDSLIESRSPISSQIAAEESAANDSSELWECVATLA